MITLYQLATSPFTEKVRRALNYKGLEFKVEEVVRAKIGEGAYKDVSPTGKFPALKDGDKAVWDSTDMLYHFEEAYADTGPSLLPASKRDQALAHAIEEWADESLYFMEILLRLTWEHNLEGALDEFSKSMGGMPKEDLKPLIMAGAGNLVTTQGLGKKPKEQIVSDLNRHFQKLDDLLEGRDWLVGETPSIADFAVAGQMSALLYAEEARAELEASKNIQAWRERLDAIAPIFKEA